MAARLQECSDQELARQSQDGSLTAFEELVCRYEGRVYGFVANFCRNGADAAEITQDTFVRAFQAMPRFDCRRAFAPWLFTIARSKCIDHHRRMPPAAMEPLPEMADEQTPAELLAQREASRDLWALARRSLPETQFQALWLRYVEELDMEGIGQALGKTQTHVKVLLFRARQALARQIEAAPEKEYYDVMGRKGEAVPGPG